jgi:hypothetical protein
MARALVGASLNMARALVRGSLKTALEVRNNDDRKHKKNEHCERARAPHTNGQRDVPRCRL